MKSKLLFLTFFIFSINAFDTNQLPISDKLKETFPKLNASCFIIANLDCSIIINESNSNKKIHTGTFDNIIFSTKLKTFIEKQNNPFLGNNKLTLYDMINIFNCVLTHRSYISEIRQENTQISVIKSTMSGYGCVFVYEHNGKYTGILYGANSREKVLNDVKNITNWLKQFYILDISNIKQNLIEIPVLYGNEKKIELVERKQKVLTSKFTSGKIERTYHYKAVACAPIKKGDILGTVFYSSEIFKNPIKIPLISLKYVKRSGILNRILDTIHYIIFGSNNSKHIDLGQNTSE